MGFFDKPLEGRPWYKRVTVVFGALTAAGLSLEGSGVIPEGTVNQAGDLVMTTEAAILNVATKFTALMTTLGIYRKL
jgi:hypothetical protein